MATYVPPRDAYELQVAVTAGRVLAREDVGVFDDLLEHGLSYEGASAIARHLDALVGRTLDGPSVLACRTVERIAARCRSSPKRGRWSSLVTLREPSAGVPLVFVHPIGGNAFWYLNLCRKLEPDQGVLALHARGLDLTEAPHEDVTSMARSYVRELQEAIPDGPYALAGWSFGGLVAFEMAQQLAARSERVALLTLFDVGPVDPGRTPATPEAALGLLVHALRLDRVAAALMELPAADRIVEMLRQARQRRIVPPDCTVAQIERMLWLNALHLAAMAGYAFTPSEARHARLLRWQRGRPRLERRHERQRVGARPPRHPLRRARPHPPRRDSAATASCARRDGACQRVGASPERPDVR